MQKINVDTLVNADIETVWEHWNNPTSIKNWCHANESWECPHAENDLQVGGSFLAKMSAKDGSSAFDFTGTYTEVVDFSKIKYTMDKAKEDAAPRECEVIFTDLGNGTTKIEQQFCAEVSNSIEAQQSGWNAILENFKKFVESK